MDPNAKLQKAVADIASQRVGDAKAVSDQVRRQDRRLGVLERLWGDVGRRLEGVERRLEGVERRFQDAMTRLLRLETAPPPSLSNLTDTSITSPASGSFLRYVGSAWTDLGLTVNVRTATDTVAAGTSTAHSVGCNAGEQLIGGGCTCANNGVVMFCSRPFDGVLNQWQCCHRNEWAGGNRTITAYAICLKTNG